MADDVTTKIVEIEVNYDDAITKIAQYRIEMEKIREQQKKYKEQLKEGAISQEEYHKKMESSKQVINQYSNSVSLLTRQVSNQIKAQKEQEGSLMQWRAQLSNLTAEYDRLSKAEREGARGRELKEKINEITTALKGAEEETQRYYRNVGNYPQAMQPMREQLDVVVAKLQEMKEAGLGTTPAFEEMQAKAEELRDKLAETSEENKTSMESLNSGVMELVATFATWYTALDGLGVKNDDLRRTMTVCMTLITAGSTAWKVYTLAQKESIAYTVANSVKTWLLNTALAAKVTALTATTAATTGATTATWLWNAALAANPLVWLIAIIVAAVAAVYGLIKAFSFFFGSSDQRRKALQNEADQLERLHELNQQAIDMAEARGATEAARTKMSIDNLKQELLMWQKHFEKIKEEYDEDDEEYKAALESKKTAQENYEESLRSGLIYLTKLQTEHYAKEKEKSMGVYKYKKTLIQQELNDQYKLAYALYKAGKLTLEQYKQMKADLLAIARSQVADINKEEAEEKKKKAEEANKEHEERAREARERAKEAREQAKARAQAEREAEKKRQEELKAELEAAQDALADIIKEGLDKQLKIEQYSYERSLKLLQEKLAKYKTESEYDVKMRQAINDQILALNTAHERRVSEFEWNEHQKRLQVQQEILQAKLDVVKKGTNEEMQYKISMLANQYQLELDAVEKRVKDGELTEAQANELRISMAEANRQALLQIHDEYNQLELDRKKAKLQAEIDAMQLAEDERQIRVRDGWEMTAEYYAKYRERGLAEMEEHQRNLLLKQEEIAAEELAALQMRGQLSTQTVEEYEAEILAAKQKSASAQKATNDAIVANEQAKAQAMKAVTSSLTQLLDTLGESNEEFAKMSKIITLAQIAIDTGKALASGIASASAVPFPGNLAAIATTVGTVLANVATAISTVKSAKFAQGGKVNGPGTGTSDSIPAMLSNGEFVMTAAATQMFEPLLVAMNGIGRGVPMQVAGATDRITNADMLTQSFEMAASEIKPIVAVTEIAEVQNRVKAIETLDTFQ